MVADRRVQRPAIVDSGDDWVQRSKRAVGSPYLAVRFYARRCSKKQLSAANYCAAASRSVAAKREVVGTGLQQGLSSRIHHPRRLLDSCSFFAVTLQSAWYPDPRCQIPDTLATCLCRRWMGEIRPYDPTVQHHSPTLPCHFQRFDLISPIK